MSRAQNSLLSAKTFRIAAAAAGVAGLILLCLAAVPMARAQDAAAPPILIPDKAEYSPGEAIVFTGANWQPGEAVTIVLCADSGAEGGTLDAVADASGSFTITVAAPEAEAGREGRGLESVREASEAYMATASGAASPTTAQARFIEGHAKTDGEKLLDQEAYWGDRQGFPTGRVNPQWLRRAARQDAQIERRNPDGRSARISTQSLKASPLGLNNAAFTALGPQPERMTGCSGCYDYTTTAGRINSIVVDPTTTTNGSIVAYSASVGGGVWKTTNCCSAATTWTVKTDDPLISTTSIDSLTIDPNDHNTIYAGTGDLNYGSFSMGSQGILKSTDAGATWTVLGADVFGAMLPEPPGQFPQYQSVGKVRVDPNDSNKVVAGTKTGLYISYNGGTDWTGPCLTNSFTSMRQDITGLELSNIGGTTRIIAAVGVRGFATTVQYNLGQNGANGLYTGTVPASGCPTDFVSIASNTNGFRYGPATTTYALNANMNAGSGVAYVNSSTGDQLGRIDIGVAPSNPDVIYAQVQSIATNSNSGCGSTNGCQLGAWVTTNGGTSWTFMTGSAGQSLLACGSGVGSSGTGDYPQNWYDQGVVVDPNNPDRVFFDTFEVWLATRTGTAWYDTTCGYTGVSPKPVHVDQHALAFVPGSSSLLLVGNDGGVHGTANANAAALNTLRPTWFNMDGGFNTIEFYSGDISGNFATAANPQVNGGAQDNGPSSATFSGSPTGPIQWQMGLGGDGFFARIDPVGTGTSLRFWQGNNSGGLSRCISNCTNSGATWTSKRGAWTGDQQSFILPFDIFHGDPGNPANDCGVAGAGTGCNHLIAGTVRVWETITGAASGTGGTVTWYVNSPANLTKGTLGNRSFINQLTFEPKDQNTVIVGTNDANVQIGYGMGTGSGPTRAAGAITLTTGGALEGETFVIGPQTFTWQAAARTGTGQVQINSSTTTAGNNIVDGRHGRPRGRRHGVAVGSGRHRHRREHRRGRQLDCLHRGEHQHDDERLRNTRGHDARRGRRDLGRRHRRQHRPAPPPRPGRHVRSDHHDRSHRLRGRRRLQRQHADHAGPRLPRGVRHPLRLLHLGGQERQPSRHPGGFDHCQPELPAAGLRGNGLRPLLHGQHQSRFPDLVPLHRRTSGRDDLGHADRPRSDDPVALDPQPRRLRLASAVGPDQQPQSCREMQERHRLHRPRLHGVGEHRRRLLRRRR